MNASRFFSFWNTLNAMNSSLAPEFFKHVFSFNHKRDFAKASDIRITDIYQGLFPSFGGRVFAVHVIEVARKEGGLVSSCARSNLHNDARGRVFLLLFEKPLQFLFRFFDGLMDCLKLLLSYNGKLLVLMRGKNLIVLCELFLESQCFFLLFDDFLDVSSPFGYFLEFFPTRNNLGIGELLCKFLVFFFKKFHIHIINVNTSKKKEKLFAKSFSFFLLFSFLCSRLALLGFFHALAYGTRLFLRSTFFEFLDLPHAVHEFFFSCVEGMTRAAYFRINLFHRGTYGKSISACAFRNSFRIIGRMNICFHTT